MSPRRAPRPRWIALAAALAVTSAPGAAPEAAAPKAADISLPEIVVTPLRGQTDLQSVPYTAYAVSSREMEQRAPRTTPDALKSLPSVMVQKTAYGQGSPFLRGFTGFRTLMMVDGIRLNNSVFRDGPNQYWNTVDPYALRGYEVVMGPASVLYGSDAIGGAVNALSKEPPAYDGAPVWERSLYYRGATAERSHTGRAEVRGRVDEHLGFVGGVTLKDFGDLEGGRDVGRQRHTGYDEYAFDARLDYWIDARQRLTLAHQTVDQDDAWRTHQTIYGIAWEGLTHGTDQVQAFDQHRDLDYARYAADSLGGPVDRIELTLSRQAQREDRYRVKKDSTSDREGFDVTTWGAALQMESDSPVGRWTYGAEAYRDEVDSFKKNYNAKGELTKKDIQGAVADNATYDTLGVYAQDRITLGDGRLDVIPGLRYTLARAEADLVKDPVTGKATSIEDDWDAFVGSLRLLCPLTPNRSRVLYAGVSQGYRAPNLSDLTRYDIARSNEIETPQSDLSPEKFVTWEAGLKLREARWSAQLGYYYTVIDDMIVRAPTGRLLDDRVEVTKRNGGEGYVQGVEWSGSCALTDTWSVRLMAAWQDGEVDGYPTSAPEKERDTLSRLMPPTAETALAWHLPGGRYWAEAVCQAAEKADQLSLGDEGDTQRIPPGGTPGYAVFTARVGARLAPGVQATLAVENILDEDYRIHGSGVNEPGRNFVLATEWTF